MSVNEGAQAHPEVMTAGHPEQARAAAAPQQETGQGWAGSWTSGMATTALAAAAASAGDGDGGLISRADRVLRSRLMLGMQSAVGNAAVQRTLAGLALRPVVARPWRPTVQRQPPATQEELDEVTRLLPVMPALDTLITAVNSECGLWRSWRSTMKGAVPGAGAYWAMDQFKNTIRGQGFDVSDEGLQKAARNRVTGDNRQLLTEMCSFALGSPARSAGDFTGLAKLCGVATKALKHKYTLKIAYSIQVKGKLGIGVSYTYRSGGVSYTNDFGMTYEKPLDMRSGGGSVGPEAGGKIKGRKIPDKSLGSVGLEGQGSDESLIFWMPDDFETSFSVTKVSAGAAFGIKYEVKVLEVVRVTSDKHPPLLFDLMGGSAVAGEPGIELGAGAGGGVETEWGKMTGESATVDAPALEKARENAEKAGLITPDPHNPMWEVIGATVIQFATGKSDPDSAGASLIAKFAAYVAAWLKENTGADIRFEIIGQASPRWRHPKKGEIPIDRNQQLSEDRAAWTKVYLQNAWDAVGEAECQIDSTGCAGPELEMDDDRAQASGKGSHQGLAETRDPDNDDAAYRVASITAWGKKAPEPPPATPPPTLTQ